MPAALLLVALSATAPKPSRIAILDIQPRVGISDALARAVTDAVVAKASALLGPRRVVGTEDLRQLLKLQDDKRKLGCTDVGCLAELGGAIGAELLLSGTLSQFGNQYLLAMRLIDTRKAEVVGEGNERFVDESQLLDSVAGVLAKVLSYLSPPGEPHKAAPAAAVTAEATPTHSHTLAYAFEGLAGAGLAAVIVGAVLVASVSTPVTTPSARDRGNAGFNCLLEGGIALVGGTVGAVVTW